MSLKGQLMNCQNFSNVVCMDTTSNKPQTHLLTSMKAFKKSVTQTRATDEENEPSFTRTVCTCPSRQNFFSPCISALYWLSAEVLQWLNQHFLFSKKYERSVAHRSKYQITNLMNYWFSFIRSGKPW